MTKGKGLWALGAALLLGCGSRTSLYGGTGGQAATTGDDGGDAGIDGALDGPSDGIMVEECPKPPKRSTWSMSVAPGADPTDPNYSPFAEVYGVTMAGDGSMFTVGCGTPNAPECWNAGPVGQGGCVLMKLDPSGTVLWQTRFVDGPADPLAVALFADDQGGVTIGIEDDETTTLGSSGGRAMTVPPGCVIERFDASGNPLFVHPIPSADGTRVFAFAADRKGNSALIANCGQSSLCGGTMGGSLVVRLDAMGNVLATRAIAAGDDNLSSMVGAALAADGTLLVAGYGSGPMDFGGGPFDTGFGAIVFATYDPMLNLKNLLSRPDVGIAMQAVALEDGSGFVIVGDLDSSTVDLGGGVLAHSGQQNGLLIVKFTESLQHVYSHGFGDTTAHASAGLCADPDGTITWVGVNGDETDFGNGLVVRGEPMSANDDGFLVRLGPDGTPVLAIQTASGVRGVGCPPGKYMLVGQLTDTSLDLGNGNLMPPGGFIAKRDRP